MLLGLVNCDGLGQIYTALCLHSQAERVFFFMAEVLELAKELHRHIWCNLPPLP